MAVFVRFRIDSAVQPVRITADANHRFIDHGTLPHHRRDRPQLGVAYPVVDSDATPISPNYRNFDLHIQVIFLPDDTGRPRESLILVAVRT